MDFGLSEEQQMIVDTTRAFVEAELYPHEAMVERTGGVPLFVEELTRAVLESGNEQLSGREIPATLTTASSPPCSATSSGLP